MANTLQNKESPLVCNFWTVSQFSNVKHLLGTALKFHLEGARSLSHFSMQICIISRYFLGTLAEMGPIHWVGVQTWLQSIHEGKWRWPPRGGLFVVTLFKANLHHFAALFGNTDSYGFYTLGRCTNLAAERHECKWQWPHRGGSFVVTLSIQICIVSGYVLGTLA